MATAPHATYTGGRKRKAEFTSVLLNNSKWEDEKSFLHLAGLDLAHCDSCSSHQRGSQEADVMAGKVRDSVRPVG